MDGSAFIVSPLTTLTQKSKKFEWSEACEKSFQLLKDNLTSAPVLTLPEDTKFLWCIVTHSEWVWGVCLCKMGR